MLLELEKKIYNQHLQFHFLSIQTAEIHSKIVNLLSLIKAIEPQTQLKLHFFQKDHLTSFLEKLTMLVNEDTADFGEKLKFLEYQLSSGTFQRWLGLFAQINF